MDETLALLHRSWAGEAVTGGEFPVGPGTTAGRVPVLIGGTSDAAVRRTARGRRLDGRGWRARPAARGVAERVRKAWSEAGRDGEPRLSALVYFGLGDEEASRRSLRSYYGFLGDWVELIVESAFRTRMPPPTRSAPTPTSASTS